MLTIHHTTKDKHHTVIYAKKVDENEAIAAAIVGYDFMHSSNNTTPEQVLKKYDHNVSLAEFLALNSKDHWVVSNAPRDFISGSTWAAIKNKPIASEIAVYSEILNELEYIHAHKARPE